jgi:NAD-dependent histone deacetylase SIR2
MSFQKDIKLEEVAPTLAEIQAVSEFELSQTASPRRKRKPRLPKPLPRQKGEVFSIGSAGKSYEEYIRWISKERRSGMATIHHVLRESRRLIVVVGAGISVQAGIPDFRSRAGLFKTIKDELSLRSSGKDMFDASVYQDHDSTSNFHQTVRDLHRLCQNCKPTPLHRYLNQIASDGRLCRLYTQNIDCLDTQLENLETKVPLEAPWPQTIQLHGSLNMMVCTRCRWTSKLDPSLFTTGDTPECPECLELELVRVIAGKRSLGAGRLRPRVVLYNEENPDAESIGAVSEQDLNSRPDGLVVVGTTLKIPGVRRIVKEMAAAVHAAKGACLWINIDDFPQLDTQFEGCFDMLIKGDCQDIPPLIAHFEKERKEISDVKTSQKIARQLKKVQQERRRQELAARQQTLDFPVSKGRNTTTKRESPSWPFGASKKAKIVRTEKHESLPSGVIVSKPEIMGSSTDVNSPKPFTFIKESSP